MPTNQNTFSVHNNEKQNIFPTRDIANMRHGTEPEKETPELDTSQIILNQENSSLKRHLKLQLVHLLWNLISKKGYLTVESSTSLKNSG